MDDIFVVTVIFNIVKFQNSMLVTMYVNRGWWDKGIQLSQNCKQMQIKVIEQNIKVWLCDYLCIHTDDDACS